MSKKLKAWFYSLLTFVISGVVNSVLGVCVAPEVFLHDHVKLSKLALGATLFNLLLYLKQSPMPLLDEPEAVPPKITKVPDENVSL